MHNIDLILTLTGGLAAALTLGYVTHRLGLSPIVGYLLAGVAVGSHTPGFVADRELAEQLAEIGVILLMFGVGLHFHLKELWAVRRVAIPGAVGRIVLATAMGAVVTRAFGWSWTAGLVFGLAISVASTVVLIRVLTDARDLHTPTGHIAVGWVVVEDLVTVVMLVLLPPLVGAEGTGAAGMAHALGEAALKIAALVAFTVLIGRRAIPWLLERVAETRSRELFSLAVLVLALGIAVGSATLFGVSMALGAFLAGTVVGRSEFSLRAAAEVLPMRDAFAVLFFVSVGMLFDPAYLVEAPGLVAATLAIVLVGKSLVALGIVSLLGYPLRVSLAVAVALAQIGEFSFIVALLGRQLDILPAAGANTLVAAAIVSITLNPLLYRLIDPVTRLAARDSAPGPDPAGAAAAPGVPPPGGGRRLRARRADGHAPLARERHRAHRRRAEPRHRAPAARGGAAGHLRRRQPPGHPEQRRRRRRRQSHPERIRPVERRGRHSPGARAEPAHPDPRPLDLRARAAGAPPGRRGGVLGRGRGRPGPDRGPAGEAGGDARADRPGARAGPRRAPRRGR